MTLEDLPRFQYLYQSPRSTNRILKAWRSIISQLLFNLSRLMLLMEWHPPAKFFTLLESTTHWTTDKWLPLTRKEKMMDCRLSTTWRKSRKTRLIRQDLLTESLAREWKPHSMNGRKTLGNWRNCLKGWKSLKTRLNSRFLRKRKRRKKRLF